jgi:excisionase family DNA binding protein
MTEGNEKCWLNISEAAKHISMSVPFLRRCVRARAVPFARAGAKALRFRRVDLDRWLEANGCQGQVVPQRRAELDR